MATLIDKLLKNSTVKQTAIITKSKIYGKKESVKTNVPAINVALSGDLDGGLNPGLLVIAGPSRHFKSGFTLLIASAFQKQYPEGIILFYDSEFGTPLSYLETLDIDLERVVHTPIVNIEELKFDVATQLDGIEKGDKVMIIVDSVGNLASKKEADDAIEGKSVADMTRAKQLKSVFRIITPHLNMKDIPMVVVGHTYQTQEMYSKQIISGGTGILYAADAAWIVGRQQDKEGTEIQGYHFIINIEKSRHVKEKTKIPISVSYNGGIDKNSGLIDLALESGNVVKPKNGWYAVVDMETGEIPEKSVRLKALEDDPIFFENLLKDKHFKDFINKRFKLGVKDVSNEPDTVYNEEEEE